MSHLMNTYARQPVAFVRGDGVWLWDEDGRKYLDALAGIAVNTLGHNHPVLVRAIAEQAAKVIHTSNLFRIPVQEKASDLVAGITGLDEVFFCNSGLEANECAIKLARLYGHQKGIAEPHIVVMEEAFHGRSLATLSATGSRKVQAGFEPLVPGFVRVPFDDLEAVQRVAQNNRNVVAVLVIHHVVETSFQRAAEGFEAVFSVALQEIVENPESYPRCDASHHFLRIRPYPYQVIYRHLADRTWLVVAVAHTSRRPRYWTRRD